MCLAPSHQPAQGGFEKPSLESFHYLKCVRPIKLGQTLTETARSINSPR
jgi:hypothetical protein